MGEVPRSSPTEFVAVPIMDDEEGELHEDWKNRALTEVLWDLNRINKRLHKHSSDRQQVGRGGSSGFYKVPDDMRRCAGSEEAALYDPKHVNFWKIRELFEKLDDPGTEDVQTLSQVRHYDYHLRSYAKTMGRGNDIEGLMWELCKEFQRRGQDEGVSKPCSRDHFLGSPCWVCK